MDRKLFSVYLLTLVNVLGYSLMIPVYPFIVEQYGGKALSYGILIASYSLFQFLGAPVLGSLADKYGRRPILIISQTGTLLSWIVFAIAYFLPGVAVIKTMQLPLLVIIFSRIIDGITGGNSSVANAYASDITRPEEKTKIFGRMSAVFGVGFIIGPVIGAFSSSTPYGYLLTVLIAGIISIVTLIYMVKYMPESLPKNKRNTKLKIHLLSEINIFNKLLAFRQNNFVYKLFFIKIFLTAAFTSYSTVVVLLVKDVFQVSQVTFGLIFLLFGSFIILNQTVLTESMSKKFGDLKTFYAGQLLLTIGMAFVGFSDNLWIFLLLAFILNMGVSFSMITFKSLITNAVPYSRQGEVNGLDESIFAAGSAVMPLVSGYVYEMTTRWSFFAFAVLLILPHLILWRRQRQFFLQQS